MSLTLDDLTPPQTYGLQRRKYKQRLIAHRRERSVSLGPWMRLQFEDALTIQYQIQEVLHAERVSCEKEAQKEIDTYAHLLPNGTHWKATLLIELPDAVQRQRELPHLSQAAHRIYVALPHFPRVFAEANEDLPDRHMTRPSAVHFLRFQFEAPLRAALLSGCNAVLGCAHDQYAFHRVIPPAAMHRLRRDLLPADTQAGPPSHGDAFP